jgi:hypothetical protein
VCVATQTGIANGQYEDLYQHVSDLCAAIIALADALSATYTAGAVSGTTAVGITPALGTQYSGVAANPAPVFTRNR